jgi:hypothetical protein
MPGTRAYNYDQQLSSDHIRLLTLLPGAKHETIQCCINRYALSGHSAYTAVSYRWGDSNPTRLIRLNGNEFLLRENLWQLLHCIRKPDEPLTLWVDAVCIDQNNVFERGHQVGIMGQIYTEATEVVVWLGPDSDWSEISMSCLNNNSSRRVGSPSPVTCMSES